MSTVSDRFCSAEAAAQLIDDGSTVAVTGFRFAGSPEEILKALGQRHAQRQQPQNITIVFSSAQGDSDSRGLDHLARPGLLKRAIGGFFGVTPKLTRLIMDEQLEAYNLPQGQITRLYHAIAAGQPGHVSDIGTGTFVDPRIDGGRLNSRTKDDIVEVIHISGREWLFYRSFPIQAALIRGTAADSRGNIAMGREAVKLETLPLAMAVKNSGGKVIVQVERRVDDGALHPKDVELPGYLVDAIVVCEDPVRNHPQTLACQFDPAFCGEERKPASQIEPLKPGERKVIARRAAMELKGGEVINLGSGIPEGIGAVLAEEGRLASVHLSLESGVNGGVPETQPDFGVCTNPEAIIRADDQFTFYDGGGLDATFLGFAQIDAAGNVNVSRFSGQLVGCGGFIDITRRTKKVVYCGTFNSGGLKIELSDRGLRIARQGRYRKFLSAVEQITSSGEQARILGQRVLVITERCVLELREGRFELREVADGIDIRRDVLAEMDFKPSIPREPALMPARCFS